MAKSRGSLAKRRKGKGKTLSNLFGASRGAGSTAPRKRRSRRRFGRSRGVSRAKAEQMVTAARNEAIMLAALLSRR